MVPLVLVFLTASPCYAPNDASPGWKQVALPDDAPALAAPECVEQFRVDDWVTVIDERSEVYRAGAHELGGKTTFDFTLGEGGRSLEVRFERPLRGAKVDVTAWGPLGTMSLMNEARVGGATLSLSWGANDVHSLSVRVHDHLREAPVVRGYRSTRRVAGSALSGSAAFRLPRSLYYRQPVGVALRLCDDPGRELTVTAEPPPANTLPTPVSLRRL